MATGYVSQISGPIPGHGIYEHNEKKLYDKNFINKSNFNNSPELNVQGKGYLGSISNRAATPKDHIQENVKRIREIQRASRLRQEESRQNRGPLKSTSRPNSAYTTPRTTSRAQLDSGAESPVSYCDKATMVSSSERQSLARRRPHSAGPMPRIPISDNSNNNNCGIVTQNGQRDYLRAHEKTGPPLELNTYPVSPIPRHPRQEKLTVPKASTAREVQLIRRDVDYVRANAYAAKSARMKRSPSADSLLFTQSRLDERQNQYKKGELPSYLLKRRQMWKEEEDYFIANQPDPDQPPGHRKMPEKERKATLELLKSTENDMLAELGRLPIRTDTLKLKARKQEIEQKLNEIEEAIKIFSKPKVFIRVDI